MARPKVHKNSAELDAEIARVQQETEAQLERLTAQRREAEGREDRQRGEVLRHYLAGPRGDELRRVLASAVGPKDRALFGISASHVSSSGTGAPAE